MYTSRIRIHELINNRHLENPSNTPHYIDTSHYIDIYIPRINVHSLPKLGRRSDVYVLEDLTPATSRPATTPATPATPATSATTPNKLLLCRPPKCVVHHHKHKTIVSKIKAYTLKTKIIPI